MKGVIEAVHCTIQREIDIYIAASSGRHLAEELGFKKPDSTRIEIVILELARNIIVHAGQGELLLQPVEREGTTGMQIVASDQGPGIADPELALQDGYSTSKTMGSGLPGVKRLMDEFELQSWPGRGTRVRATRWMPLDRGRHE